MAVKSFLKESRHYPAGYNDGRQVFMTVLYTLFFEDSSLVDVRNENYHSVERNSECGNFFFNKYKK